MNKPEELITTIMNELSGQIEEANHGLCVLIDTLTDEDGRPLPHLNADFVEKLKDIAYSLYQIHDNQIQDEIEDMVATMKHFYKPKM
jgi:hypothetical protein